MSKIVLLSNSPHGIHATPSTFQPKNLTEIEKVSLAKAIEGLKGDPTQSAQAGKALLQKAREYGLNPADYIRASVARDEDYRKKFGDLDPFTAARIELGLPTRDDFSKGVFLQAASDTFQTYTGVRALFPDVIDSMLRSTQVMDQVENTASIVSNTRSITGNSIITTFLDDSSDDDMRTTQVSELGDIPVRTIMASEKNVRFFKHGSAYRTSYEFNRRVTLDSLTPFAARVARQLELTKVRAATAILVNGDGINPAATTLDLADFGADFTNGKTLSDNYKALSKLLVKLAKGGTPIDTLLCNWDTYWEALWMFTPTLGSSTSVPDTMAEKRGLPRFDTGLPILNRNVKLVLSSAMPEGYMLGFIKAETLEELVETGSQIAETERSITTQAITYVRSEVTGYQLTYPTGRFMIKCKA